MKISTFPKGCMLALAFIFASNVLNGQSPTVTAANSNPVIGETFLVDGLDSASIATFSNAGVGANQTWDFSTLTSSVNDTLRVVSVASTPHASDFSTADLCFYYANQQAYDYYIANSNEFARAGAVSGGQVIPYDDPAQFRQFPMSLGDSYTDSLHGDYFSGVQLERIGIVSVEADAFGTVIMPYGTFNGVLRLKVTEDYEDRSAFSTTTYDAVTYQYHLPGQHFPLVSHTTFSFFGQSSSTGSMLAQQSVSALEAFLDEASFFLYPNPSTEQTQVRYTLENAAAVSIRLVGMNGQEVYHREMGKQQPGEYDLDLDVSGYASGLYFLDLRVNDNRTTRKLQVN